jgi:hypothetical protein
VIVKLGVMEMAYEVRRVASEVGEKSEILIAEGEARIPRPGLLGLA